MPLSITASLPDLFSARKPGSATDISGAGIPSRTARSSVVIAPTEVFPLESPVCRRHGTPMP